MSAALLASALEALGAALIALGVVVTAVAVYGVLRLRGLYPRLQAASKASMLGAVAILAGSVGTRDGAIVGRALVVALFLLLTTPVAAHAIASAAYRRGSGRGRGRGPGGPAPDSGTPARGRGASDERGEGPEAAAHDA